MHSSTETKADSVPTSSEDNGENNSNNNNGGAPDNNNFIPPWSMSQLKTPSSKAYARFRQHVNPLARRYQMSTDLPENWPQSDFKNVNLPLYLDIGCGKGGFLLELCGRRHGTKSTGGSGISTYKEGEIIRDDTYMNSTKAYEDTTSAWLPEEMNYLGLEIRPGVSQYAQARVMKRGLDGILSFVGCNANVDLDRLLTIYNQESSSDASSGSTARLAFVSIQFPDPHFKKAHSKRRVVTPELVSTLAKFMKEGDVVFLQSDIKEVLEAMRERFVEDDGLKYFDEYRENAEEEEYQMDNPLGIPTEREVSVVKKGLPIFRTLFTRNGVAF